MFFLKQAMLLVGKILSIVYHFFRNRYNVGFLPFLKMELETFSKQFLYSIGKGFAIEETHNVIIE